MTEKPEKPPSDAPPIYNRPEDGRFRPRARFFIYCLMAALAAAVGIPLMGADYWRERLRDWGAALPANVDMRFGRLTLNEIDQTGRLMIINAETALYNQSQDLFDLQTVQARVEQAENFYDISAATGRYDRAAKMVSLNGQVRVVSGEGGALLSDNLILKFGEGLMSGEKDFCYASPEYDLSGSGFVYDARARSLAVDGRAHLFIF